MWLPDIIVLVVAVPALMIAAELIWHQPPVRARRRQVASVTVRAEHKTPDCGAGRR
jgi:hypothetical protein